MERNKDFQQTPPVSPNDISRDNPDTFVFYPSFLEQIEVIKSDKVKLALYTAITHYGIFGETPDFSEVDATGVLDSIFIPIRREIDAAKQRRGKVRLNGQKGGAPNGNANAKKSDGGEENDNSVDSRFEDENGKETTKNNQKQPKNNPYVDVDVDKKNFTNVKSQKDNHTDNHKITTTLPQDNLSDKVNKNTSIKKDITNVIPKKEETSSSLSSASQDDALAEAESQITIKPKKKVCDIDFEKLMDYYNSKVPVGGMPQAIKITEKRKAAILAREKEYGKDAIQRVIDLATASSFLNGNNETGFKGSFDWIFLPRNFIKILEGNYDNSPSRQAERFIQPTPSPYEAPRTAEERLGSAASMVNQLLSQQ